MPNTDAQKFSPPKRGDRSGFNTAAHLAIDQFEQSVHSEIARERASIDASQRRIECLQLSIAEVRGAARKVAGMPALLPADTIEPEIKRIAAKLAPQSRGDSEPTEADQHHAAA
jgi:hypothetical protein